MGYFRPLLVLVKRDDVRTAGRLFVKCIIDSSAVFGLVFTTMAVTAISAMILFQERHLTRVERHFHAISTAF